MVFLLIVNLSGLTDQEREEVFNTELVDIITTVTGVDHLQIPRNVFLFSGGMFSLFANVECLY